MTVEDQLALITRLVFKVNQGNRAIAKLILDGIDSSVSFKLWGLDRGFADQLELSTNIDRKRLQTWIDELKKYVIEEKVF